MMTRIFYTRRKYPETTTSGNLIFRRVSVINIDRFKKRVNAFGIVTAPPTENVLQPQIGVLANYSKSHQNWNVLFLRRQSVNFSRLLSRLVLSTLIGRDDDVFW